MRSSTLPYAMIALRRLPAPQPYWNLAPVSALSRLLVTTGARAFPSRHWLSAANAVLLAVLVAGCGGDDPADAFVRLEILSEPGSGATVLVNGEPHGETPVTVNVELPGPVLVELEKEGYRNEWETVRLPEDSKEHSVTIAMRPLVGFVTIESTPPLARVSIDNEPVGETPVIRKEVPAGTRTIRVEADKFIPQEQSFEVEADFYYTKAFQLVPQEGRIQVFSIPTGARILINNLPQTQMTPAVFTLPPGTYRINVYTKGYVEQERVVELTASAEETLELKLLEGAVPEGMVLVPAGEFTMGFDTEAPDERPERVIDVPAFYIDKYEVTNEQYKRVFPAHEYAEPEAVYPVSGVTWEQATAYAKAIGKRLPTEIEWEKAARGTDKRAYPWGNNFNSEYCSSADAVNPRIRSVGTFPENISPFGCFDMAGNVREWTQSWYEAYPGNPVVKTEYGQVYRVLRGGSYLTGAYDVRSARRHYERMDVAKPDFGFRCAADVVP